MSKIQKVGERVLAEMAAELNTDVPSILDRVLDGDLSDEFARRVVKANRRWFIWF